MNLSLMSLSAVFMAIILFVSLYFDPIRKFRNLARDYSPYPTVLVVKNYTKLTWFNDRPHVFITACIGIRLLIYVLIALFCGFVFKEAISGNNFFALVTSLFSIAVALLVVAIYLLTVFLIWRDNTGEVKYRRELSWFPMYTSNFCLGLLSIVWILDILLLIYIVFVAVATIFK